MRKNIATVNPRKVAIQSKPPCRALRALLRSVGVSSADGGPKPTASFRVRPASSPSWRSNPPPPQHQASNSPRPSRSLLDTNHKFIRIRPSPPPSVRFSCSCMRLACGSKMERALIGLVPRAATRRKQPRPRFDAFDSKRCVGARRVEQENRGEGGGDGHQSPASTPDSEQLVIPATCDRREPSRASASP